MRMEHFEIKTDDNGVEYVTYAEGITKTRQSGLHEKTRTYSQKRFLLERQDVLSLYSNFIDLSVL